MYSCPRFTNWCLKGVNFYRVGRVGPVLFHRHWISSLETGAWVVLYVCVCAYAWRCQCATLYGDLRGDRGRKHACGASARRRIPYLGGTPWPLDFLSEKGGGAGRRAYCPRPIMRSFLKKQVNKNNVVPKVAGLGSALNLSFDSRIICILYTLFIYFQTTPP